MSVIGSLLMLPVPLTVTFPCDLATGKKQSPIRWAFALAAQNLAPEPIRMIHATSGDAPASPFPRGLLDP
ncbi:MAG: hypothetical protein DMG96_40260 [Acidobacteria bacterium]|nr:MAG: hypothetical protein DMG96_40260 [Acidobacteriota bacterium]